MMPEHVPGESQEKFMYSVICKLADKIVELVNAHNELLDTHTVKEEDEKPCACGDDMVNGFWHSKKWCEPLVQPTTPEKKHECVWNSSPLRSIP